jgi:hypothetical protein
LEPLICWFSSFRENDDSCDGKVDIMLYPVAQHGRVFSTRERGAELRRQIEAALEKVGLGEPLILDVAGVELISFSVADEIVGKLLADRAVAKRPGRAILLAGANEDALDPIVRSLRRRDAVGAHLEEGGSIRLLAAPEHLQATFEAAQARGKFRSTELAADLGIAVSACNNRLKPLLAAGLLEREARAGGRGREFVYHVTARSVIQGLEVA